MAIRDQFKKLAIGGAMLTALPFAAHANDSAQVNYSSSPIAADYVQNCQSNSCAGRLAMAWSELEENKNAVAVAVAMGTAKQVPDYKIKEVLTNKLESFGISNVKFFFEQNDIENTSMTFHVRGGTDGVYVLNGDAIKALERIAAYANSNDNIHLIMNSPQY